MSDNASLSYCNREVHKLVLGNADYIEPVHPNQLQWVAHWTQASSSSSLQTKVQTGRCHLPVETVKQSYGCQCRNSWRCDVGRQDQISYMLQSVEAQGGYNGRFRSINNSVLKQTLNPSRPETLEKLSNQKLPASSVNWENFSSNRFQNSKSLRSEWSHFPPFDINRKVETHAALKKRGGSSNTESLLAPNLIEVASEGYHEQSIAQTDREISPYEFLESLPYYNCHGQNTTSSIENYEEYEHFCSGLAFKEHFANANLTYLKHELCNCSKNSTVMVSEMRNNDLRSVGSSWTRPKDGSSSCPCDVPQPYIPEECNKEIQDNSGRNKTTLEMSRSNKMPSSSPSGRKSKPAKHPSGSQCMLIRKEVDMDLCHNDQIVGDTTASANTKATAFFEKLTLPPVSCLHGQQENNSQILANSINNTEGFDNFDTQFMNEDNEPSIKSDDMHINVDGTSSCHEAGGSTQSQKIPQDVVHRKLKSSEMADKDSSSPESMAVLSSRPFNPPTENTPRDSEPSWKWVKRLRPNSLDSIPLGSKRLKVGDTSTGEMQNLLARVVNYNRSIFDLPDYQQLDKTTFVPKNGECSPVDSAKVVTWIRRWCKNSQDASPTPVMCEPENSKVPTEKFEAKQFPSLAAMALMGRQVTNFRPCEFRRKGSTTVWNI